MENFLPRKGYCVVQAKQVKTTEVTSTSGIILETEEAIKHATTDRVIVVFTNCEYEVGDELIIPDNAGKVLVLNNKDYIIIHIDDILGQVTKG